MQYIHKNIFYFQLTISYRYMIKNCCSNTVIHVLILHMFKRKLYHILFVPSILFYEQNKKFPTYNSKITVNGPSFSNATFISAPNSPVSTTDTCFLHSSIIYSYNSFANSGFPASVKDGRLP